MENKPEHSSCDHSTIWGKKTCFFPLFSKILDHLVLDTAPSPLSELLAPSAQLLHVVIKYKVESNITLYQLTFCPE